MRTYPGDFRGGSHAWDFPRDTGAGFSGFRFGRGDGRRLGGGALRGAVLQLVDGQWAKLDRGDVVPDSRVIRTLQGGMVEFQRGEEHVSLGGDTQIQIYDEVRKRPFTTVKQYFGTVTVEAKVEDVQHFAVQNNYLAAVVKGTRFTVSADDHGASVDVERGAVFVEDRETRNSVTVAAGQSASVDDDHGQPVVSGEPKGKSSTVASSSEDTPSSGKTAKSNSGKSDDEKSNNGKSEDKSNSGKGKSDDEEDDDDEDSSRHGKSGDEKSNNGKSGDNSGKGKGKSGDDDEDD